MTKDDLQKFCSKTDPKTNTPFSRGLYTYATDGVILVRVGKMPDIPERENIPAVDKVYSSFNLSVASREYYHPVPDFPAPKTVYCRKCGSKGKDYTCPECSGTGKVEWETCYHDYQSMCKSCRGFGIIEKACSTCEGAGSYQLRESFQIGDQHYDKRYLTLIRDLHESTFSPGQDIKEPGHFKFSEGDGFIMPLRKAIE